MLINNNGINNNALGNSNKLQDNAEMNAKASKTPPHNSEADSVKLSEAGHSLSRLESAVANADDVDTQRVESIRKAIDDGSYAIDAEAIATKLLTDDSLS